MRAIKTIANRVANKLHYGTWDFFRSVEIETSTACNRRCTYCPNVVFDRGLIKNNKLMDETTFHKVINELSELEFLGRLAPHFYNEPMMDDRLCDLMAYARKKLPNVTIEIFTNGDYLDIPYYKKLKASGVNALTISQHGEKMPRGVQEVLSAHEASDKKDFQIVYRVPKKDIALVSRGGLVKGDPKAPKLDHCSAPSNVLTIDFDGNVVLCCNDYLSTIKWGNVKTEKILDIWQKTGFKKLRAQLRRGNFELEICRICANPTADA